MNNKSQKTDIALTREVDINQKKHVTNWKKLIATILTILLLSGITATIVYLAGIAKA